MQIKKRCKKNRKTKVIFFINSLGGGGAEQVMVTLLRSIDRQKIDPVLMLLQPYDASPYREMLPDYLRIVVNGKRSDSDLSKLKQAFDLVMFVRRERPDVIVSMLTHNNLIAIFIGILLRIKVIPCEHCALTECLATPQNSKLFWFPVNLMVKLMYKFASSIVTVSSGIKAELIHKFFVNKDKIHVIYNPIDIRKIQTDSQISVMHERWNDHFTKVIAMGRLVHQKGFDMLIEAFSQIVTETDARLFILGDGPERDSLKKKVSAMGMKDRIYFEGFQKNPYQFLSRADLYVLSSRYEGLPMVLLEALACSVPIIATDCEFGPNEILEEGRIGVLVPKENIDALAAAMLRVLKDRRLRRQYAALGKRKAEEFSIEKITKQYESLICKVSGNIRKSRRNSSQ